MLFSRSRPSRCVPRRPRSLPAVDAIPRAPSSRVGPAQEPRAKPILRQLTGALAYLHEHKIAHRDVKPENVLVSSDEPPRVTLIDFGLSKALLEEGDEEAFPLLATSVGKTFVGTPCYLAPEIEAKTGVPRCCGAFTPSMRLVSISQ